MNSKQYYTFEDFGDLVNLNPNFKLCRTDTYHESKIHEKIIKIDRTELLCSIAIQLSIVGFGTRNGIKSLGSVHYNGAEINIEETLIQCGFKTKETKNSFLEDDDLTPRRLIRFFRYSIYRFLNENENQSSYLYKKYSPQKDTLLRKMIFPGVEHILNPLNNEHIEVAKVLLKTYRILDAKQKTDISTRIERVLIALGFQIEDILN